MIDRVYGKFELSCDVCGEPADEQFDSFQDAVDYKKSKGWESQRCGDIWQDACPDCHSLSRNFED